jgi:hypothetical protein
LLACLGGQRQIDTSGVEEAWADLQQLPVPLHDPPVLPGAGKNVPSGIVEFGQLSEAPVVAGTIGPLTADVAVAKLESISRTLDTLQESSCASEMRNTPTAEDFCPTGNTEVELVFHGAHDPFGGDWEEEEVVIDRYASLEDATLRSRRVTSQSGRRFGAGVAASAAKGRPQSLTGNRQQTDDQDPCDGEYLEVFANGLAGGRQSKRAAVSLQSVTQDDRDMIIVDEEQPDRRAPTGKGPRRPEYRQLFSRLKGP